MSRLLDKLRGAQRSREESGILFDALKKAHAEREASRGASEAISQASEPDGESATTDAPATPMPPKPNDARTAAFIAILVVAAALCAAIAWQSTADIDQPSQPGIDTGVVKRSQPQVAPEPGPSTTAKKSMKE